MIYLNYMPQSLERLNNYLKEIKEKNKIWKITHTIQSIEAYHCQLDHIQTISRFSCLQDLDIGSNPGVKTLKGIEKCLNLRNLNCNNCDLEDIDILKKLQRLEILNLANNKRITSIESLSEHSELIDLFLRTSFLM